MAAWRFAWGSNIRLRTAAFLGAGTTRQLAAQGANGVFGDPASEVVGWLQLCMSNQLACVCGLFSGAAAACGAAWTILERR